MAAEALAPGDQLHPQPPPPEVAGQAGLADLVFLVASSILELPLTRCVLQRGFCVNSQDWHIPVALWDLAPGPDVSVVGGAGPCWGPLSRDPAQREVLGQGRAVP